MTERDEYTPTWLEIRERVEHDTYLTADEADAWLAEHEAALIEGLADEIRHKQHAESIRQMLREKARQRREEKP